MSFWNLDTLALEPFRPGIHSRAELGEQLVMAYMEIAAGEEESGHQHPYDQCGVVVAGRIEMFVGSERKLLGPRESYFIPAGQPHGWKTFDEAATLLDITPAQPGR